MNTHTGFKLKHCAFCVGLAVSGAAVAQDDAANQEEAKKEGLERIVVTGSRASNMTLMESSVAVTLLDEDSLRRKVPRSTADALELIPGFSVEDTGGEVSNNFTVRGLQGGSQWFVQLLEDGLPVKYSVGLADAIVKYDVGVDRIEAVRGGTSGVLTVQGAGAAVNFISRSIGEEGEGTVRITGSDYGTKKVEMYYGGPLGGNWYGSATGVYRLSDGVRDPGYTADKGGNIKLRLENRYDTGKFGFTAKAVDERNTFFLPTPFQNPDNPTALEGFDPLYGTMLSLDNAVMVGRSSQNATYPGKRTHNLLDGMHTQAKQIGFYLEQDINDELTFNINSRYINQEFVANAVFTFDNNAIYRASDRIDPAQFGDVQAMLDRFAGDGAVRAGVQYVSGGGVLSASEMANLNGNGFMTLGISRSPWDSTDEFVSDISVDWETDNNTFTAGILFFNTRFERAEAGVSNFLMDVSDNTRRMDIVALDADDNVVGYLTENGILDYGSWGEGAAVEDRNSTSLYVNNEYEVNDDLRVDFGIRHEKYEVTQLERTGYSRTPVVGAFDENGNDVDNIIANNFILGGTSTNWINRSGDHSETTWTIGGNYKLDDNFAVYGRYADTHHMNAPQFPNAWDKSISLEFAELGLRYQSQDLIASATLFNSSFNFFPVETGTRGTPDFVQARRAFDITGVEFDLTYQVTDDLRFDAIGMVQSPKAKGFNFVEGNVERLGDLERLNDTEPGRSPKTTYTLMASYSPIDQLELYGSYQFVGKRWADDGNSIELPDYNVVDLGASYFITDDLTLNVHINNVTDEIGLTEGNPRGGIVERGTGDIFYARSIPGRNMVFSLTYDF